VSSLDIFDQPLLGTTNVLVSSSFDKTIKLWNIYTGECLMTLKVLFPLLSFFFLPFSLLTISQGHKDFVTCIQINKADGTIVSSSNDKTIKVEEEARQRRTFFFNTVGFKRFGTPRKEPVA